jgi:hypothetical protein
MTAEQGAVFRDKARPVYGFGSSSEWDVPE